MRRHKDAAASESVSSLPVDLAVATGSGLALALVAYRLLVGPIAIPVLARVGAARRRPTSKRFMRGVMSASEIPASIEASESPAAGTRKKPVKYGDQPPKKGLGLLGPAAEGFVRQFTAEVLTGTSCARVIIPIADLDRLFGDELDGVTLSAFADNLVVPDTLEEALSDLDLELLLRSGEASNPDILGGAPPEHELSYLVTTADTNSKLLCTLIEAGADKIFAVLLGAWPHGLTCTIDESGVITDVKGHHARGWHGRHVTTATPAEAAELLRTYVARTESDR